MEIDYKKIIFKKNVFQDVAEFLQKKDRVLVIASCESSKKYLQGLINYFKEQKVEHSIVFLAHNIFVCDEEIERVCEKASTNYSCLVSFGANTTADITKIVATKLNLEYVIVPTTISHFGYFSDIAYKYVGNNFERIKVISAKHIFIDEEIIKNSNTSFVFSTYSFVMSFFEHVVNLNFLEEIYNISYSENITQIENILVKTEGLLNWLALGNKEAILTLMEYVVELFFVNLGTVNVINNSLEIALLSRRMTSTKNFGKRCLFYSEILLNVYKKFLAQKKISIIDVPNFKNLDVFVEKTHFFSQILPNYLKNSEKFLKTELFYKLRIVKTKLQKYCEKKLILTKKVAKKVTSISENFGITKYVDENKFFGAISSFPVLNFDTKFLGIMLRLGYLNF